MKVQPAKHSVDNAHKAILAPEREEREGGREREEREGGREREREEKVTVNQSLRCCLS